jgi:hypothetical protein
LAQKIVSGPSVRVSSLWATTFPASYPIEP